MNDPDRLSELLNQWQVAPSPHPDFATEVRERIQNVPASGFIARVLRFPATLPLAASIAIMLGVSAAISADRAQRTDQLATAYAQKIDPIQMTALSDH